jgi:hypothetical protein
MTPQDWERMSWPQRLSYLRNLTDYERELRRREQALSNVINSHRRGGADKGPNPAWTRHQAEQFLRLIPKDSIDEIRKRQQELVQQ